MPATLRDGEAALAVRALEHYAAYLIASNRADSAYQNLAARLKRKPAEAEATRTAEKRKKA